jgi:hypothetical protein
LRRRLYTEKDTQITCLDNVEEGFVELDGLEGAVEGVVGGQLHEDEEGLWEEGAFAGAKEASQHDVALLTEETGP